MLLAFLMALSPVTTVDAPPAAWMEGYDRLRIALVADLNAESVAAAQALAASPDPEIAAIAGTIAAAPDLPGRRKAFGDLSRILVLRLEAGDLPGKVLVYYCPMAAGYGYWLQPKAGIANPYMGQSMPGCGNETALKAAVKAAQAP